jgi:ferredoxin-fold anticodon binding domain-containing protein
MFGPRVNTFKSQTCVIAESDRITAGPWRQWWEQLVTAEGGIVVKATPTDHDQTMLVIQVLLHYMTLTFGITLKELPFNPSLLHAIKTPPFELMGPLLARVFSGTPGIYFHIQRQADASAVRSKVQSVARRLSDIIEAKDVTAFESLFKGVKDVIGESNLHAFEVSATEIFDHLSSKRATFFDSVGRAVCIRNIDSGVTHYGILESVSPSSLSIRTSGGRKELLNTKRTRLLSEQQAKEWAAKELTLDTAIVKFRCAKTAKPQAFVLLFQGIGDVVDATIVQADSSASSLQEMSFRLRIMPLAGNECDGSIKTILSDFGCEVLSWSRKLSRKRPTVGSPKK